MLITVCNRGRWSKAYKLSGEQNNLGQLCTNFVLAVASNKLLYGVALKASYASVQCSVGQKKNILHVFHM